MNTKWEDVPVEPHGPTVRRFPVPGGWIYRTYGTTEHNVFVPGTLGSHGSGVAMRRNVEVALHDTRTGPVPKGIDTYAYQWEMPGTPFIAIPTIYLDTVEYASPQDSPKVIADSAERKAVRRAWWDRFAVKAECLGMLQDGMLVVVVAGKILRMHAACVRDLESEVTP
jgi:hypothetical protein